MGHWPAAASAEVRAHVAGCRRCSDLVLVDTAIRAAKQQAVARAQPEPASLIWWRAQLRKRQQAMVRVSKPIWRAQMFAVVVSGGAALAAGVWQAIHGAGFRTLFQGAQAGAEARVSDSWGVLLTVLAVGVVAMLGAVAVYLTLERE